MNSYPMGVCIATTTEEAEKLHEFMLEQMGCTEECGYEVMPQTMPEFIYVVFDENSGDYVCATMTKEKAIEICNIFEDYTYDTIPLNC